MNVKYVVRLTEEERAFLMSLVGKGKAAAQKIKHANVLLKIDAAGSNWSDDQAAEAFDCARRTILPYHSPALRRSGSGGRVGT